MLNTEAYRESLRKQIIESEAIMPVTQSVSTPVSTSVPRNSGVLDSLREKLFGANVSQEIQEVSTDSESIDIDSEQEELTPEVQTGDVLTADDLNDLATDTIAEVLNSIKELRDNVKKENPKKAALIRRIYDHLLKGKDKITSEILKTHQEESSTDK